MAGKGNTSRNHVRKYQGCIYLTPSWKDERPRVYICLWVYTCGSGVRDTHVSACMSVWCTVIKVPLHICNVCMPLWADQCVCVCEAGLHANWKVLPSVAPASHETQQCQWHFTDSSDLLDTVTIPPLLERREIWKRNGAAEDDNYKENEWDV